MTPDEVTELAEALTEKLCERLAETCPHRGGSKKRCEVCVRLVAEPLFDLAITLGNHADCSPS